MQGPAQIVIDRVSHRYRPPRGREVLALDDVSLEIANREFVALLGPSGCGKSTLLYLIGGFLPVVNGAITVDGRPIATPGPDRGIVFQHFALFPWKTVRGNIRYGLERQGMGASRLRMLWDVVVPSAMPELLNGVRTALALSFILLVSAELIVAHEGFGYLIGGPGANGTYDAMYAVVLTVAFLGFAADRVYLMITERVLRWRA